MLKFQESLRQPFAHSWDMSLCPSIRARRPILPQTILISDIQYQNGFNWRARVDELLTVCIAHMIEFSINQEVNTGEERAKDSYFYVDIVKSDPDAFEKLVLVIQKLLNRKNIS